MPLKPLPEFSGFGSEFRNLHPKGRDLGHQQADHRLGFRRPTRDLLFGDFQRHAMGVAKIAIREKPNFQASDRPGA